MSVDCDVEITDTLEYGGVLKCFNIEIADQFEDFLTENCFVLFNIKLDREEVTFYFGQASSTSKIRELYGRFMETLNPRRVS